MADEGCENRAGSVDLNLYLGLPRSPRPRSLDLGSDLALSSLPLLASSNSEESRTLDALSGASMEATASTIPYSPSQAAIGDADVLIAGFRAPVDFDLAHDYTPCFPSYEPYGTDGPSIPYSPSNIHVAPINQELGEREERNGRSSAVFDEESPINPLDDSYADGSVSHTLYSPAYIPGPSSLHEEERFLPFSSIPLQIGGTFAARSDGSSSQAEFLRSPEFRLQRLIESHQCRIRRFRSSLTYENERTNFFPSSSPNATELMQDIMNSQISPDADEKHNISEDYELKNTNTANFECNICFDMANEPVVTSCGHLFCWSCLFQWLHVHSDSKECPVCKGEVTEANIVPIYGRGSSGFDAEKTDSMASDLKIPPRPRGNRLESWRQHLRPITRRFGEGITNSWRRLLTHQMRNRSRFGSAHEDAIVNEMLNAGSNAVLTRSMARRLHREENNDLNAPNVEDARFARETSSSIPALVFQEGNDIWQRFYGFPGNERLSAMTADIGRAVGRFSSNGNRYGPSTSVNAQNSDHFSRAMADQASASSTAAVIHGESSAGIASAEPNSAGSSRPQRRRGRSNASAEVDGGATLHVRKRRRLN